MFRARLLLLILLAIVGCASPHKPALVTPPDTAHVAPPTLITEVRVFTGLEDELSQPVDVLLAGGRVAKVAMPGELSPPADAEIVDGKGRTLLPGLVDMNVRLGPPPDLAPWAGAIVDPRHQVEALLYSGITTAVVVGHDIDVEALQKDITQGKLAGPRMFRSSFAIAKDDAQEQGPFARFFRAKNVRLAKNPKDAARAARRDFEYLRSDFAKVDFGDRNGIGRAELEAVVAEAHMYEREVFVDAKSPEAAAAAAQAGAAYLLHPPWTGVLSPMDLDAISIAGAPVGTTARVWSAMSERLAGSHTTNELEGDILGRRVSTAEEDPGGGVSENTRELAADYARNSRENLRELFEMGVPLLVGTGAGLPGIIHGASIHQELEALVAMGIPSAQVLKMATSYPVRLLSPQSAFGVIGIGAYADLLLVEGDPLEDIAAVGRIVAVWQAGRRLDRLAPPDATTGAAAAPKR